MNLRFLWPWRKAHPPTLPIYTDAQAAQHEVEKRQARLVERQAALRAELDLIRRSGGRTV